VSGSPLQLAIRRLAAGEHLTEEETAAAFDVVMRGEGSPTLVSALLMALRVKGETSVEVAGGARAMRRAMLQLETSQAESLVDTCGTGGGRVSTFNISTAAALLAAGAGVRVAKHGNRSHTSLCGSADVLEALGVAIEVPVSRMRATLEQAGIVFMFAPLMHPAMRHVAPVRRELGIPTLMNVLGPLANPAGVGRQVVGVAEPSRQRLLADALAALGTHHALVVHGEPGLDEVSPLGPTRVLEVRNGTVCEWVIDPVAYRCESGSVEELAGGSAAENARTIVDILSGEREDGGSAAVLLNAAAAIYVAGLAPDFRQSIELAREANNRRAGLEALERLRLASAAATPITG